MLGALDRSGQNRLTHLPGLDAPLKYRSSVVFFYNGTIHVVEPYLV